MRYAMCIDINSCVACAACTMACKAENGTPPGSWWCKVYVRETGYFPASRRVNFPTQCMHCQNPPCATVCPTGATYKTETGRVLIDYDKCMGCRYCELSCPYDVRTFLHEIKPYYGEKGFTPFEEMMYKKHQKGTVEKCTFCNGRVEQGKEPACVTTCIASCRIFGDLDDPNSEVSRLISTEKYVQLMPECGTDPSIFYLGLVPLDKLRTSAYG